MAVNWLKVHYLIFGYVHVPGVINTKKIFELRNFLDNSTHKKNKFIYANAFYENKLHKFFLDKKIVDTCRLIFGKNFLFSNGGSVQHDNYGIYKTKNGMLAGVHIDSDFQFFLKDKQVTNFTYKFAKLGIYLQDSEEKSNVLVLPGSHIFARLFGKFYINKLYLFVLKAAQLLMKHSSFQALCRPNLRAGDALIFDCLLIHSSDFSTKKRLKKKYVLYTEVGDYKSMINFIDNNVRPRAKLELESKEINRLFSRDPNRYNKQLYLAKYMHNFLPKKFLKFFYTE